ncbi:MAG TPA: TolC family protein [Chthoniobacteraceae bacterium]|nr:TolC family protein [Chthoniobacteraceae bacterium]
MKPFLIFTILTLFINNGGAADPAPARPRDEASISLDEVTQAALSNNPAIQSALKKWDAMKARIPQAGAWDDPKVSATSRVARYVAIGPNAFTDQMLSIEQLIPLTGKNLARARAAAAEAVAAYEVARRQQLDVVAKTRVSYFRLANVYAQLELNRRNLVSLKQIAEVARAKYQVGDQSAAFVLTAETEYSKLMEVGRDLELQLATGDAELDALMGRDAFAPLGRPAGSDAEPVVPAVEKLREIAMSSRPEVRIAAARAEQAKAVLQLARREWIPDPAVVVEAQRYDGASQAVSEVDAGVSFNIPWVNYRKYSSEIREAADALDAAQRDLDSARLDTLAALREAVEKAQTMHHHIELYRDKIVPQAQQAFEASGLGYENGKVSFLDWIAAQRTLRDLQSEQQQAIADYQTAVAELEAIIGSNLTTTTQTKSSP